MPPSEEQQGLKLVIPDALGATCTASALDLSFRPKMTRIGLAFFPPHSWFLSLIARPYQFFIRQKKAINQETWRIIFEEAQN